MKEFIEDVEVAKIEELRDDFIELMAEIEESEKDQWESKVEKLKESFDERIDKVKELAMDPKNLKITIWKKKLYVEENLIRLFRRDRVKA